MKIRIGGVPEHFNLPIHIGIDNGSFYREGIEVEWIIYNGGTGEMNAALRNDDCDLCIVLTEGIIADISRGNSSKIISGYVKTPLIWGIHTGINNELTSLSPLFDYKFAISRWGSGSHLMPIVNALDQEKSIPEHQFITVGNLEGAIKSLNRKESDVFYWEKYTTKPYVDNKIIKRIGEFISPWPCFVIAATDKIIGNEPELLDKVLKIIHKECISFMNSDNAIKLVSEKFSMNMLDAGHWYHATEWASNSWVSNKMLTSVLFTLREAGIVSHSSENLKLVWER